MKYKKNDTEWQISVWTGAEIFNVRAENLSADTPRVHTWAFFSEKYLG